MVCFGFLRMSCYILSLSAVLVLCKGITIQIPHTVVEGSSLTILCTSNTASAELTDVFVNSRLSLTPSFAINGSEARFTVALVSRTDNGNVYTCADAADGSSAISDPLNVLFPPSAPRMLNLSNTSPFWRSVRVTWSTPSDIGNPPDHLTYTVTLTNITDGTVLHYTFTSTQITLSNLLLDVQYNVSVNAKNSVGSGPPVTGVFRINSTVPIIKQVAFCTQQLRLFVNITMVFNGGLPISAYHITFNGQTTSFPSSSEANQFGTRLELIGVMLREGDTFPLSVQVENELGNSTQVDSLLVGINAPNVETIAVPVLSASVGLFGALTLTSIVAAIIIVHTCACRKKSKGVTEDSLAPPYESPVEVNDVHKRKPQDKERGIQPNLQPNPSYEPLEVCVHALDVKDVHNMKSQDQERGIQPTLEPNPSYEPLEVCVCALEVKDAHKKNCVPEEQETSVDTKMQPNPSYEPLEVLKSAFELKDIHEKNCVSGPEEQETSVDTKMQPNPSYEPLMVYEPNYL